MRFVTSPLSRRRRKGALALAVITSLAACIPYAWADKTAADYFVHSLPGAPEGVPLLKMHAGHIEVTPEHHGNLFFWHFQNRHLADRSRTILWLNGGPGCSSEDGALMEIGPYRVREGGKLELIDGSWDEFANVLFVDNPVGTGFSYVDTDSYVQELTDMADQMVAFLEKFYSIFPEYSHDDLYLAGESYAGQHIPYVARSILDRNKAHQDAPWNLKGLLIGNGWISGVDQYPSYLQYAYKAGLLQGGSSEASPVEHQQAICNQELSNGGKDRVDTPGCESVLQELLRATTTEENGKKMCYNMYDVRLKDTYPSCGMNWPPDLQYVTPYLRQKDVTAALHVSPEKKTGWQECNGAVSGAFRPRNSRPSIDLLPGLLEEVPIVLFSGEKDLICNHLGTEELINNMEWNGGKGFEISPGVWAPRRAWTFEGEPAGLYQEARNLTYVLFHNSSHMVPFDYPRRTRDMVDRFMGVDIASIGGKPADSRIDGEKTPSTSVGGHPNSTAAEKEQADRLKAAEWKAYYKSGEVALVVVAIAAAAWGWYVYRDRRKRAGYQGVLGGDPDDGSGLGSGLGSGGRALRMEPFRESRTRRADHDVEAADFDIDELETSRNDGARREQDDDGHRYSLGADSEDDEEHDRKGKENGRANGHSR